MSPSGWWHLLAALSLEAGIVVCVTALLCRCCRPAWQRTLWHAMMLMLLGLLIVEAFGIQWNWRPQAEPTRTVSVVVERMEEIQPMVQRTTTPVVSIPESQPAVTNHELPPTAAPQSTWWPAWVWLAGTLFIAARSLGARILFWMRLRRRKAVTDQTLHSRILTVAEKLNLGSRFRISESELLPGPVAFGVFLREIALPGGFANTFTTAQQDAVLAHELEHLRAHDPFWYSVRDLVTALYWWNPAVWYMRRKLQTATEQAADEASALVEDGPEALAECLIAVGKKLDQSRTSNGLGIEGNGYQSGLGKRVTRLLKLGSKGPVVLLNSWKRRVAYTGSLLIVALCTLTGVSRSSGEQTLANAAWAALHLKLAPMALARANERPEPVEAEKERVSPAAKIDSNGFEKGFATGWLDFDDLLRSNDPDQPLHSRWWPVDAVAFPREMATRGAHITVPLSVDAEADVVRNAINFFKSLGVDLSPPKNIFYSRSGRIMVRATTSDLNTIDQALRDMDVLMSQRQHLQLQRERKADKFSSLTNVPPAEFTAARIDTDGLPQGVNEFRYAVDKQNGLIITTKGPAVNLHTKWLKVDPAKLQRKFGNIPDGEGKMAGFIAILEFFRSNGVELSPPKNLFYNDRLGMLMVRGTRSDLQAVEKLVEEFKASPNRVRLRIAVFIVPDEKPPGDSRMLGLLTRTQANRLLNASTNSGWHLVAESLFDVPSRERTLVKFKSLPDTSKPPEPIIHEKTPAIFVEPVVSVDGYTIELNVTQTIDEFVRFESGASDWDYVSSPGVNPAPQHLPFRPKPKPIYYQREAADAAVIWDGQTIVLGGLTATNISHTSFSQKDTAHLTEGLGSLPTGKPVKIPPAKKKNLLVVLTPTLVDETGKPLHEAKDMPFAENNVPPQRKQ